jgi:hypothetical protein
MRNIMAGFAVLGTLALGSMAPASAHPLAVPQPVVQSHGIQQADWENCGPRCSEHRREVREREQERHRWAQHRRWEDSRYTPAPAYGYQHRY